MTDKPKEVGPVEEPEPDEARDRFGRGISPDDPVPDGGREDTE